MRLGTFPQVGYSNRKTKRISGITKPFDFYLDAVSAVEPLPAPCGSLTGSRSLSVWARIDAYDNSFEAYRREGMQNPWWRNPPAPSGGPIPPDIVMGVDLRPRWGRMRERSASRAKSGRLCAILARLGARERSGASYNGSNPKRKGFV